MGKSTSEKHLHLGILALGLCSCVYSGLVLAVITTGRLVIYNGLGNATADGLGSTASPIRVVVSDAVGACSTTASVAYGGVINIAWSESYVHSSTLCNTPSQVTITPVKPTNATTVQYDSTANPTPPTTATAITLLAPTTVKADEILMITGNGTGNIPMGAAANAWGGAAASYTATTPLYDATNGSLLTTGIPGAKNVYSLKARHFMQANGIGINYKPD